ncbi:MAG: alpha/beta hydrolase family protein [Ignavibacteriales bacterium]
MSIEKTVILDRDEIILSEAQNKMIASGWGQEILDHTVCEKITYLSDGLKVKGYFSYPKENKGKKFPCVIWNRGGYENKGAIDQFTAKGMYGQIASWGYVVFASQYRGSARSEGKEEVGGKDVNDILNLIPLADEFDFADKTEWGIEGWSRGGMMTFLTLLKNPNFSAKGGYASGVKCAVLVGAISDFKNYVETSDNRNSIYKKILGEEDFEKKLEERTIINFVDKLPNIPYLIMHGKSDETVPVEQSINIAAKLKRLNYNFRLELFEGGDHYLKKHRKEVDEMRRKWYEKYLK